MKPCPLCQSQEPVEERVLNNYPLLACTRCGFVYADIGTEAIEAINSSLDEVFAASFAEQHQSAFEAVFFRGVARRYTQLLGPGRVLDVGCGNGLLLSYFRDLGWECTGIDLSPWSREYARRYDFEFLQGRLEDQGFAPGAFNLLTSTSTLEHIADPVPHLASMLAAVRPGGGFSSPASPTIMRWRCACFPTLARIHRRITRIFFHRLRSPDSSGGFRMKLALFSSILMVFRGPTGLTAA